MSDDINYYTLQRLKQLGWGCAKEWSQPGELGQIYVLTKGKNEERIPVKCIEYFVRGLRYRNL